MGFKYRSPSIKIGGIRIRKNKNGYSISSKTITGGRKTYNTSTGKTTTTYKTGIKGLSYQIVSGGKSRVSKSYSSVNKNIDTKSDFLITLLLGWLGVHKFMKNQIQMGIIYLFTLGLFGIGWMIDIVKAFILMTHDINNTNTNLNNLNSNIEIVDSSLKDDNINANS